MNEVNEVRRRISWPDWLNGQTVAVVTALIASGALVQGGFLGLRSDMNQLRGDMNQQITDLRGDMNQRISELRGELGGFRSDVREEFDQVDVRLRAIETRLAISETRLGAVERHVGVGESSPALADARRESLRPTN